MYGISYLFECVTLTIWCEDDADYNDDDDNDDVVDDDDYDKNDGEFDDGKSEMYFT